MSGTWKNESDNVREGTECAEKSDLEEDKPFNGSVKDIDAEQFHDKYHNNQ